MRKRSQATVASSILIISLAIVFFMLLPPRAAGQGTSQNTAKIATGEAISARNSQEESSTTERTIQLDGKTIPYKATAGTILLTNYDLTTPFLEAQYTVNHLDLPAALRSHITLKYYETGHMMYLDPAAHAKLKANVAAFIEDAMAAQK